MFSLSFFTSCVSKKKYHQSLKKQDTISQILTQQIENNYPSNIEFAKLKAAFLEHSKEDSIKASNVTEVEVLNHILISFPNPPP